MPTRSSRNLASLSLGQKVEALYKGGSKYYPGKISKVNSDGTYNIAYDDGDSETRVRENYIRSAEKIKFNSYDSDDKDSKRRKKIKVGTKVEAKYGGKGKYYPGKISKVNNDGTYNVEYDDGDRERYVIQDNINVLDASSDSENSDGGGASEAEEIIQRVFNKSIKKGDLDNYRDAFELVDSNGNGKLSRREFARVLKQLKIKITESELRKVMKKFDRNNDGEISYNEFVKMLKPKGSSSKRDVSESDESDDDIFGSIKIGSAVEANFKGKGKYYAGKVSKVYSKGLYFDVNYNDGDFEKKVPAKFVRLVFNKSPRSNRHKGKASSSSRSRRNASPSADESDDEELNEIITKVIDKGIKKGNLDDYYEAFELFDRNGDGKVSKREFERGLNKLRLDFSPKETRILMRKFDKDGDGVISYKEFIKLIKATNGTAGKAKKKSKYSDSESDDSRGSQTRSAKKRNKGRGSASDSDSSSSADMRDRSRKKKKKKKLSDDSDSDSGDDTKRSRRKKKKVLSSSSEEDSSESEVDEKQLERTAKSVKNAFNMSSTAKDKYRSVFDSLDKHNKGYLSQADFAKALKKLKLSVSRKEVKQLSSKFDSGGDKSRVDYKQFVKYCKGRKEPKAKSNFSSDDDDESSSGSDDQNAKLSNKLVAKVGKQSSKQSLSEKQLNKAFQATSSYNKKTHCVSKKDFEKSLKKLHFDLSKTELKSLENQYSSKNGVAFKKFVKLAQQAAHGSDDSDSDASDVPDRRTRKKRSKSPSFQRLKDAYGLDDDSSSVKAVIQKLRQLFRDAIENGAASDYHQIFEMMDVNGNGIISKAEFKKSLEKIGFDLESDELSEILTKFKTGDEESGPKGINYKGFLKVCGSGTDRERITLTATGQLASTTYVGEVENSIRSKIRLWISSKHKKKGDILRLFKAQDAKKHQYVSMKGLKKVITKCKWGLSNEEVAILMSRFDLKGSGKFSYNEFISFLTLEDEQVYGVEERLREYLLLMNQQGADLVDCFQMFDRDQDGKLSVAELSSAMTKLGFPVSTEEVTELVRRLDVDRDGKIGYPEFLRAFSGNVGPTVIQSPSRLGQTLQLASSKQFNTGVYYDWTMGAADTSQVPLAPRGSVGEWLENTASPMERRNFFEFLNLISKFERRLGLQQNRSDSDIQNGEVILQLGTKLKVKFQFSM